MKTPSHLNELNCKQIMKPLIINAYTIIYNSFLKKWQCSHDGVIYEEFKNKAEAIEYCEKG
jgi:hypothetical protein